jgi:hypothetical protein
MENNDTSRVMLYPLQHSDINHTDETRFKKNTPDGV